MCLKINKMYLNIIYIYILINVSHLVDLPSFFKNCVDLYGPIYALRLYM